MPKTVQAKSHEFNQKQRKAIAERDNNQCIFCNMHYHMAKATWNDLQIDGIMHYIPRSRNGLGIEQNGAIGCKWHHRMFDNGSSGRRDEMQVLFQRYLQSHYKDWDESKLIYYKWSFLEEVNQSAGTENSK